jgi:hypothetical protein
VCTCLPTRSLSLSLFILCYARRTYFHASASIPSPVILKVPSAASSFPPLVVLVLVLLVLCRKIRSTAFRIHTSIH